MVTASWVRRVAIGRDALVFSLVRATLRGNRLQTPSLAEPFRMVTAHVDISLRAELFRQ